MTKYTGGWRGQLYTVCVSPQGCCVSHHQHAGVSHNVFANHMSRYMPVVCHASFMKKWTDLSIHNSHLF